MATGAQQQHFGVLLLLDVTMSYPSVINHFKGDDAVANEDPTVDLVSILTLLQY